MSDKNIKLIRKQIHNVVQGLLPTVLSAELVSAIHKSVAEQVEQRLNVIATHMKTTLEKIDERSKEIQAYTIRNTTAPTVTPTETVQPSTS